MKKKSILFIVAIFAAISLSAQAPMKKDSYLVGDVLCNGKNLPFATVTIKGTTVGTITNRKGHFGIRNLPEGKHIIVVRAVGFKSKEKEIEIKNNKKTTVKIELTEDIIGLEEVVVSSNRGAVNRKETSIIVNSLRSEVFAMSQSVSLIEGLDFAPGLRTECNCQNCGFSQVRMNGLEGPYSQILINSRPIFSGLAGVYGLELFPANMVDRVEIVRGGGSALFGGNAIAGTINIITKEPVSNSFMLGSEMHAVGIGHESSKEISFDKVINFNGSILSDNKKTGMILYGMIRDRDPYDDNGDGFSEEVLMKNQTIGISTYYKPSKRTKISLDMYSINEFRRGGNKFEYLPHESDITEQLKHNIFGANLSFDLYTSDYDNLSVYTSMQNVDRESYYGAQKDPGGYGETGDITTSSGLLYSANLNFITKSKFLAGVDYNYNHLEDIKLGAGGEANTVISNQTVGTLGSFMQYELDFSKIKISAGLRYDNYQIKDINEGHNDISGNVVSPRANILFKISDHIQLRTSYANGYRAPQIFDEDLHIETSGARRITHSNSLGLKQETSNSFTGSLTLSEILGHDSKIQTEFVFEGFYTVLKNPFANISTPINEFGTLEFIRVNAEHNAYVYGANIESNIAFSKDLMFQLGFTYQKSKYEVDQPWDIAPLPDEIDQTRQTSKYFMRSPDTYGYITANYSFLNNFNLSLTGTYTGKMLVPHLGVIIPTLPNGNQDLNSPEYLAVANGDVIEGERLETSDMFFNMGLKLSYDLKIGKKFNIKIHAGVQNILDQTQHDHDSGIYRDAGYIYGPHKSRTITYGLELSSGLIK